MEPLLSIRLTVDYPQKPQVLQDVRLDIQAREIYGLVGQSGSGKSTLALAILQLLGNRRAKLKGSIRFAGRDLLQLGERELQDVRGRQIGLVLQNASASLNPHLRLRTQLKEAWRAHSRGDWRRKEAEVLDFLASLDLKVKADFLDRYPSQISVGQAQRVLLAMATIHRPPLVLMDEPTSALDPIARAELLELFRRLNRDLGTAVLYISHDLATVAALCHRISILREGSIIESGTPGQIFQSPREPYTQALVRAAQISTLEILAC